MKTASRTSDGLIRVRGMIFGDVGADFGCGIRKLFRPTTLSLIETTVTDGSDANCRGGKASSSRMLLDFSDYNWINHTR